MKIISIAIIVFLEIAFATVLTDEKAESKTILAALIVMTLLLMPMLTIIINW